MPPPQGCYHPWSNSSLRSYYALTLGFGRRSLQKELIVSDLETAMEKSTSRNISKERDSITNTLAPEREANRAARRTAEQWVSGQVSEQHPASVYWQITRNENGRLKFLTLSLTGGEEVLPVFSSEEEAEMFLSLGQVGFDRWQTRQSTVGELISELYRSCAHVKRVALDPSPEMLIERMVGLVSLSREHFADLLVLGAAPYSSARRER